MTLTIILRLNEVFDQTTLATFGLGLVFAGFVITFLAVLLLFIRNISIRGRTRGGGLIMIGPIPIIFGTDKEAVKILLILSIVLMVLVLALTLLPRIIF
jgi:uncharacterized protein (TIGR00304 family)